MHKINHPETKTDDSAWMKNLIFSSSRLTLGRRDSLTGLSLRWACDYKRHDPFCNHLTVCCKVFITSYTCTGLRTRSKLL